MERLLRIASPLGLYAEEFEVERSRHLGNFPQAFSHLALIQAAGRIVLSRASGGAVAVTVVVLGGGLAGVACAHKLGDEGVDVVLVDRNDYHQFQPLLYQVATSQLPAEDIARPHRTIFREYPTVEVRTAEVVGIDPAGPKRDPGRRNRPERVTPRHRRRGRGRSTSAYPERPSTRSRCTRSRTPNGSGSTSGS